MNRRNAWLLGGLIVALLAALSVYLYLKARPYQEVIDHGPSPLAQANPYLAAEMFLRERGLNVGQAETLAVLPEIDPSYYPRMVERYRYHFLSRDHELVLFPGVQDMLVDLSQSGYFLAVATGKSRVGLNRAMNDVKLLSMFDATRCADETFSKPHPAMLQELTRELGQDMRRTVMIGDTSHDLLMANNAGAAGVAVQYGAHPVDQLAACKPLYSAATVAELHQWLSEHA